jgi:type I restriction-modification system DNA methylase subunit
MAKSSASTLFIPAPVASRRVLILSKFLYSTDPQVNVAHITFQHDDGPEFHSAHAIIKKWADMERKGLLKKKETALDANFLNDIFGTALRYIPVERAANGEFTLDRQLAVPGIGPVDGALGFFPLKDTASPDPIAVIELKGADIDLDTDKSNGRTAVQQLFDYLNGLPKTNWGIVSNFSSIRLYRKGDNQAYESFSLQKLATDLDHFKAFWCLLEKGGLLPSGFQKIPRADDLLTRTGERQKEVGDRLYEHYAQYRSELIATLEKDFDKPLNEAIRIAQKIFDRIIFVAFCEDRGLIKQKSIHTANQKVPAFHKVKNPRWQNFVGLFHGIDKGHPDLEISHGYNGGLFAEDKSIDDLDLPDQPWTTAFEGIAEYDFKDEVSVDVLGHIFERSITELEKKRETGDFGGTAAIVAQKRQKSAERKRFGIYYTPRKITRFIVQQAVGELLNQRFADLEKTHGVMPHELAGDFKEHSPRLQVYYQECLQVLREFKVVDPACGSGAFLIAAYELLEDFYHDIAKHLVALGVPDADKILAQIPDFILKDNLYGVDLSPEAVEISRLALWIRSARPGKTLTNLTDNVICGNSLVSDSKIDARAMEWHESFPNIISKSTVGEVSRRHGFDAVVGNPPYIRQEKLTQFKDHWRNVFTSFTGGADIFVFFFERAIEITKQNGRIGFITSGSWVKSRSASKLRNYISATAKPYLMVDFGEYQPFEEAEMIRPTITVLNKSTADDRIKLFRWLSSGPPPDDLWADTSSFQTIVPTYGSNAWELIDSETSILKQKLLNSGVSLKEYVGGRILYGIKTGANEVFVISQFERDRLVKKDERNSKILKAFVQGTHLRPWYVESSDQFLIFTRRGIKIEEYPVIESLLADQRVSLEPRPKDWKPTGNEKWPGRKPGEYKWYEIQDAVDYWEGFDGPKIVWPDISKLPRFSMDLEGRYLGNTGYAIPREDYFLLGLLSSWATWFYISVTAQPLRLRGGRWQYRLTEQYMRSVPVPNGPDEVKARISDAARKMSQLALRRYHLESKISHRLLSQFGNSKNGVKNRLNRNASKWWRLKLHELGAALKESMHLESEPFENPSVADQWERYLIRAASRRKAISRRIIQLKRGINEDVNALFKLTPQEVEAMMDRVKS